MFPRLRGHHLICLQFYRGEGYDEVFVENLERVIEDAKKRGVLVVEGVDDVCAKCPYMVNGKCEYSFNSEEEIKYLDVLALSLLNLSPGCTVSWKELKEKVFSPEVLEKWKEEACKSCDWRDVCEVGDKG